MIFTEQNLVVPALYPDADLFGADPATDIFNMKLYGHICFIVTEGAGGTGTYAITVEQCTDNAGTGATAIAFNYRIASTPDTWGALTAATASGFTTTAGANKQIAIEIGEDELADGSNFVRVQFTESVDSPVDASVIAILSKPRYEEDVLASALS